MSSRLQIVQEFVILLIWNAYLYAQDNPVEYQARVSSERTVELKKIMTAHLRIVQEFVMLLIWNAYLYTQDNPVEYQAYVSSERTVGLYDPSPLDSPGVCHVIDMECLPLYPR